MLDNQFYPTPPNLASKMWETFDRIPMQGDRVLEPSAGRGDLIRRLNNLSHYKQPDVDVIEIDFSNQAVLKELKFNLVGLDFLQFEGHKYYSHIIMNPPFNVGAKHVLRAWDILKDGELVALVNAETLRNPTDKNRQMLSRIIQDNEGTVTYHHGEFLTEDTQRTTSVEVVIIHLKKGAEFNYDFIDDLKTEIAPNLTEQKDNLNQQLALPTSTIEQAVRVFNAAAKALRDEVLMCNQLQRNTQYYRGLLSDSLNKTRQENANYDKDYSPLDSEKLKSKYNERYDELKERAWSHILRATEVGQQLSKAVMEQLQKDFKEVSSLEFTESNIRGFLLGLVEQRTDMNKKMILDVFDMITKYHSENRCYYLGWKSNDKHKLNAYRVGTTRFILPIRTYGFSSNQLEYESRLQLKDFDLAFATLDAADPVTVLGVADMFENDEIRARLNEGERVSGKYFDIRYFPGRNTVHFFPRDKKLIERLNSIVGKERQWLPPEGQKVDEAFWVQYDKAEKITTKLNKHKEFKKLTRWDSDREIYQDDIRECIIECGEQLGLKMGNWLEHDSDPDQKLLGGE